MAGERYRVTCQDRRLSFGRHVVERYQERVKPMLSYEQVRVELGRVLPMCEFERAVSWANGRDRADGWLVLGDGITFPIQAGVLTTCITRSEVGAEIRVRQAAERRAKAADRGRPGARKKHGKVARSERARVRRMKEGVE